MPSQSDIHAQIMAKLSPIVQEKLTTRLPEDSSNLTLTEMENMVGELVAEISQEVLQELVDKVQDEHNDTPHCEHCGGVMKHKGKHDKIIRTEQGRVNLKRPYYYCEHCQDGFFPPG